MPTDASRITVEEGKRSGQPLVRGLCTTVKDVLGYLAAGMSKSEIIRDFPELTAEDVAACIEFGTTQTENPKPF